MQAGEQKSRQFAATRLLRARKLLNRRSEVKNRARAGARRRARARYVGDCASKQGPNLLAPFRSIAVS
jgi:hypothetical protein